MTLGETLGLSDDRERLLTRALQAFLVALMVYGLVRPWLGLTGNAGLALAVTLVPALLRREYDYSMDPGLVLWIAVALVLHVIGSLGPYQWYSWYDEITHTVSAMFVAGIGYSLLRAFEDHTDEVDVPPNVRSVFVVVFVLAFGVFWEVFEFAAVVVSHYLGVDSPVKVFGIDDIVGDMIFNTAGAAVVALWGTGYFDGVVTFLERRLGSSG